MTVLVYAASYVPHRRQVYLDGAREYYDYVIETLEDEPSRFYTRIWAILLSNADGHAAALCSEKLHRPHVPKHDIPVFEDYSNESLGRLIWRCTRMMVGTLPRLSLERERRWLSTRLGSY
ncbi:MAG: hypothetical protein AAF420_08190 [Pseudomonadota bacterium]